MELDLKVDPRAPTPVFLQIRGQLEEKIRRMQLVPGEALPSERRLAEKLGVSRLTVRRAYDELVAKGMLERRQGSGTYVARRLEQPLSVLTGFSEDMRSRGMEPGSRWVEKSEGPATPEEALALSLAPGELVVRLGRVRLADGRPMALEYAVLPKALVGDARAIKDSLYAHLRQRGLIPVRALQRLRAVAASEREAQLLGVPTGAPLLYIERISYLESGRPLEFTRSHYRGDRYDFLAELKAP